MPLMGYRILKEGKHDRTYSMMKHTNTCTSARAHTHTHTNTQTHTHTHTHTRTHTHTNTHLIRAGCCLVRLDDLPWDGLALTIVRIPSQPRSIPRKGVQKLCTHPHAHSRSFFHYFAGVAWDDGKYCVGHGKYCVWESTVCATLQPHSRGVHVTAPMFPGGCTVALVK